MEGPIIEEFPSRGHKLIFGNLVRREIEPQPQGQGKILVHAQVRDHLGGRIRRCRQSDQALAAYAFRQGRDR